MLTGTSFLWGEVSFSVLFCFFMYIVLNIIIHKLKSEGNFEENNKVSVIVIYVLTVKVKKLR